jgi:hypothetical protein
MSKRELKKYLSGLTKKQLEEQVNDLYLRFKEVKTYYDFAFNPKEDKLLEEYKFKVSKEYFPVNSRKAKMRRSVAQKFIKQFKTLEVDAPIIADAMLFNIEIAQAYSADKLVKQDAFFISMLKSFQESLYFLSENGLIKSFELRVNKIIEETIRQHWFNYRAFENAWENYRS